MIRIWFAIKPNFVCRTVNRHKIFHFAYIDVRINPNRVSIPLFMRLPSRALSYILISIFPTVINFVNLILLLFCPWCRSYAIAQHKREKRTFLLCRLLFGRCHWIGFIVIDRQMIEHERLNMEWSKCRHCSFFKFAFENRFQIIKFVHQTITPKKHWKRIQDWP